MGGRKKNWKDESAKEETFNQSARCETPNTYTTLPYTSKPIAMCYHIDLMKFYYLCPRVQSDAQRASASVHNVQITVLYVHPPHRQSCCCSLATVFIMAALLYHRITSIDFLANIGFICASRLNRTKGFASQKRHDSFITMDERERARHVGDERDVIFELIRFRVFPSFAYYLISNLIISHYYAPCIVRRNKRVSIRKSK